MSSSRLSGKHRVNACTSQGMHVERQFEVIENTGGWRRCGGADFVKLREPKNMANWLND
jgi:hypothetical protein